MIMNASYVNCDVGVDGGTNRGRVIDGWRARGSVPPRKYGDGMERRNRPSRRAKKWGRGGSFPSPKGEEDPVECWYYNVKDPASATTTGSLLPHGNRMRLRCQAYSARVLRNCRNAGQQSFEHTPRRCPVRKRGAGEEAPLSSPANGGKKGSARSAVEIKHLADRSGRLPENCHYVNSHTTTEETECQKTSYN